MNELNLWALEFEDTVFSLFSYAYNKKFKKKYKDLYITQDEEQDGTAIFPTVLVKQIDFREVGRDISGNTINGIDQTFQVTISYKGDRENLKELSNYAVMFFKSKKFGVSNVFYNISNKIRTATFRASRVVGANDTLV